MVSDIERQETYNDWVAAEIDRACDEHKDRILGTLADNVMRLPDTRERIDSTMNELYLFKNQDDI